MPRQQLRLKGTTTTAGGVNHNNNKNNNMWLSSRVVVLSSLLLLIMIATLPGVAVVVASSSSSNYSPYQYDMTTPLFTPDGRLLQVEYAAKAVDDYASPLLIIPFPLHNHDDANDNDKEAAATSLNIKTAVVALTPRTSLFERLVVLQPSGSNNNNNAAVIVALSGVLPDGMALLQKVQDYAGQQQRIGLPLDARALALFAANLCHQRAVGGGLRPYGARLTLIQGNTAWVTDPSGSVQGVNSSGGGGNGSGLPVVLAGDQKRLSQNLAKMINTIQKDNNNERESTATSSLLLLQKVIQECLNTVKSQSSSLGVDNDSPSLLSSDYRLQVVLVSTKGDIYKLTPAQANQLLVDSSMTTKNTM